MIRKDPLQRIDFAFVVTLALALAWGFLGPIPEVEAQQGDETTLRLMNDLNDELKPQWLDYRVEQIQFFTIGNGRPSARLHQQAFRWVPGDPRRHADGTSLSYLVDPSWGTATASGIPQPVTEAVIDRAMEQWASSACLEGHLSKRRFPGGDVTIFDYFLDRGEFGEPFAADIVHAGWLSEESGLMGPDVLGISVTFIFVDPATGEPTDLDGDHHLDTALNEIYYNDRFRWTLEQESDGVQGAVGVDLETVVLHEAGHAFGVGHFGSPPEAVMNPVYQGERRDLFPMDHAGLCTVWGSWGTP